MHAWHLVDDLWSWFSPSTFTWVLGLNSGSWACVASAFVHWAVLLLKNGTPSDVYYPINKSVGDGTVCCLVESCQTLSWCPGDLCSDYIQKLGGWPHASTILRRSHNDHSCLLQVPTVKKSQPQLFQTAFTGLPCSPSCVGQRGHFCWHTEGLLWREQKPNTPPITSTVMTAWVFAVTDANSHFMQTM